jgi:hypothetical protein
MPNDWSLVLVGASFQIFHIMNTLLIKILKIYVIDISNE